MARDFLQLMIDERGIFVPANVMLRQDGACFLNPALANKPTRRLRYPEQDNELDQW
jgi:hypothetical protein